MRPFVAVAILSCWTAATRADLPFDAPWNSPGPFLAESSSPLIQIVGESGQITITFAGTLESADVVGGIWTEVTNATSPYHPDATGVQKYYRARVVENGSVFSTRSVVEWVVTGPLQKHFDLAFAGMPDGIFPPHRDKPQFDGTLQMAGADVSVTLRVRGNSSLQECPFPKLKVKISKEERQGTPFFDAREIKIGTHCAEGGRGTIGRLRDERATFREALAYELMELLGFTGPRVRRARIDFRDSSPTNGPSEVGWQVIRNAVILDDPEVIGERLGGRALDDEELAALKDANFGEQLITDLRFLHVLLGNWDYALTVNGEELWNTDVIRLADGRYIPVAGDFDLASMVTEEVLLEAPWDYHPELPDLDRQVRYKLDELKRNVAPPIFASAQARFFASRTALELQVNTAEVDGPGRTNAVKHVAAFYDALAAVAK